MSNVAVIGLFTVAMPAIVLAYVAWFILRPDSKE